ncbi:MAG: ABC transporter substrate-binding protein [Propionibacteriales bacterium]|nr:ABC transporter substrate-binding protein [Propionibacteriales bacterium]
MKRRLFLSSVVAAAALSGCSFTGSQASRNGGANGTDRSLTVVTSYVISDLDPKNGGYWGPEFAYIELLMHPQVDGKPTPWVLSRLEAVDDLTWRLTLNEGVTFVNGKAFDADALVRVLTWSKENVTGFSEVANLDEVAADGPLTVTLTTTVATPSMPNLLADESNVLVMDVEGYQQWEKSGEPPAALIEAGIYTGPYQVVTLDGRSAELAPVTDHWQGAPALDRLRVRFVSETTARIQAVQSGEADLALYMPISAARTVAGRTDSFFLEGAPSGLTHALISRVASPVMRDAEVRRAIFEAIDYRAMAQDVLQGHGGHAKGVFPASFPYAIATQTTDPASAAARLDTAGWAPGPDGMRKKDGRNLVVRVLCSSTMPDGVIIAEAVQAQLKGVGIQVKVSQVDDLAAAREADNWDVSLSSSLLSFGGSPDQGLFDLVATGGSYNYAKIGDPELDRLIKELRLTAAEQRRNDILQRVQTVLWERGYYAVAAERLLTVVVGPTWQGYRVPLANLWVNHTTAPDS